MPLRGKKVVVLTGAGISEESGVRTFRDNDGLWENRRIEDVATPEAWTSDPSLVWSFYQARRRQLLEVEPNPAHMALARLEGKCESLVPDNPERGRPARKRWKWGRYSHAW